MSERPKRKKSSSARKGIPSVRPARPKGADPEKKTKTDPRAAAFLRSIQKDAPMISRLLVNLAKSVNVVYESIKYFPVTVSALYDLFDEYERRPPVQGPSYFDIIAKTAMQNGDLDPENITRIQSIDGIRSLANAFTRCRRSMDDDAVTGHLTQMSESVLRLSPGEISLDAMQQLAAEKLARINERSWRSYYPEPVPDYAHEIPPEMMSFIAPSSPYYSRAQIRDLDDDQDLPVHAPDLFEDKAAPIASSSDSPVDLLEGDDLFCDQVRESPARVCDLPVHAPDLFEDKAAPIASSSDSPVDLLEGDDLFGVQSPKAAQVCDLPVHVPDLSSDKVAPSASSGDRPVALLERDELFGVQSPKAAQVDDQDLLDVDDPFGVQSPKAAPVELSDDQDLLDGDDPFGVQLPDQTRGTDASSEDDEEPQLVKKLCVSASILAY